MTFGVSPGVVSREIDLTTIIPVAFGTNTAFAGQANWGPIGVPVLTSSEPNWISTFTRPTDAVTGVDYLITASILAYTNSLYFSRIGSASTDLNAVSPKASLGSDPAPTPEYVPNAEVFTAGGTIYSVTAHLLARYPSALGNGIGVIVCDGSVQYASPSFAPYRRNFPAAPSTSEFVSARGGSNDEIHILVIDNTGAFSGIAGQILETYPFVSKASNARTESGTSNYYIDVLNNNSLYVYGINPDDSAVGLGPDVGLAASGTTFTRSTATSVITYAFTGGVTGVPASSDKLAAYDVFKSTETVPVSVIAGGTADETLSEYLIQNIAEARKDCVVFISPPANLVVGKTNFDTVATNVANYRSVTLGTNSSYGFMDSGWKYMYDKYNDVYRWIPLNGDIAGLCSTTDRVADPWYSIAGFSRGQIKNVVRLAWNPNEAQRDVLYQVGVNPVVAFPGQGTVLYGDKTLLSRTSAFDRINVRRLFIILRTLVSTAAQSSLFEFNDEFTRAQFVSLVEPFLRDIQGRRGITDFRVVCDETNNTPQVIDSNQFKGDIYVKPARSINFILLSFVAVRTGVAFEEVVGQAG